MSDHTHTPISVETHTIINDSSFVIFHPLTLFSGHFVSVRAINFNFIRNYLIGYYETNKGNVGVEDI